MDSFIYYGLVYFVEALIIWQYSTQMFSSKYPKLVQLCLSIALYIIPFLLSFTENVWINFLSFFIISFIYLLNRRKIWKVDNKLLQKNLNKNK